MFTNQLPPVLSLKSTVILLLAAAIAACSPAPEQNASNRAAPVTVIAEPMRFESATTRIEAVGTSRALRSIALHPASAGEVVAVNFDAGQHVTAGKVLVELDSRDEKLAVELARVRLADAERLLDRYQRSGNSGAVLPTAMDAAETQVEAARIELGRAQVALDDRYVKAPFDGYVDVTDVDPGDRIGVDTRITTLDDRSKLLVSFTVPELMVGELGIGDEVALVAWNRASTSLAGEVVELGSRIDPGTRTFIARATVANSDDALRPGMSFRVSVNAEGQRYPVIAETAVQWGADGAYIWLIVDGVAVRRGVNVIQRQKGRVLVDADLTSDDLVVVEGIQRMRNELPVNYEMSGASGNSSGSNAAGSY